MATTLDDLLKQAMQMSSGGGAGNGPQWGVGGLVPIAPSGPGFLPVQPPPQYAPSLPPVQWPDNTLIREMLARMDKELAEALKLLLKRLDKIEAVVERIEQSGRYSS